MAHPLDGAIARISRARKHHADLQELVDQMERACENVLDVRYDQQSDEFKIDVRRPPNVPIVEAALVASDMVHNLRAALDYLVYELARLGSGIEQHGTQFPIESTAEQFNKRCRTYLRGVLSRHVTAIERLQPYKGVDWTGTLRDISNPDKHRTLTLPEGNWVRDCTLTRGLPGSFSAYRGKVLAVDGRERFDVKVEFGTAFRIEFAGGFPVVETLDTLRDRVTETIHGFMPDF